MCVAILAASLTLAVASAIVGAAHSESTWLGGLPMLPTAAAAGDGGSMFLEGKDGTGHDSAARHAFHKASMRSLHPSTLVLSGYPTVGGGAAELVFTVTYGGDLRRGGSAEDGPSEPPLVRLDVTGSHHAGLYRVTNITSNIGTAAPGIFEAYDHEAVTVRAEQGATYTVRAMVEFVAEGFIPVYALGFDGDIVTINVAASEITSMPYSEYVATRQTYLDSPPVVPASGRAEQAGAPVPEKRRAGDQLAPLPPQLPTPSPGPLEESVMPHIFNVTGTVMGENATLELVPVHGIRVCMYDRSPALDFTRLNTTANEQACAYTDAAGRYEITNVNGADPDDMTAADVFASVESYGYGGAIALYWHDRGGELPYDVYYVDSDVEDDYSGTALVKDFNLSETNPDDGGMAGAARIIDAMSDGMAFFEPYGWEPVRLIVWWNYMGSALELPDSPSEWATYSPPDDPYSDIPAIYLAGKSRSTYDESLDRNTMLHEFGHYVHDTHEPFGLQYSCPEHSIDRKYDERCAWGEGWAGLVPHLVDGTAAMPIWVPYLAETMLVWLLDGEVNIEAGHQTRYGINHTFDTFEDSGRPIGEKVEGTVAAAMWDMADDRTDPNHDVPKPGRPAGGGDDSSAGVDNLLNVFFAGSYRTFADFYDSWEIDMRHDSAEGIAILHGMSFAIPSNTSYYGFAGELGGVFERGISGMEFEPNYVAVSDDGSTVAVTSINGSGLQMVDALAGKHMGLYATYGHDYACTLAADPLACMQSPAARETALLGPAGFSSMDGITFGLNSSMVLVSDGTRNRIQAIGSDGAYLGGFGSKGSGSGEFLMPGGLAFLADDTTLAVADAKNSRIQTFEIARDGSAQHGGQFASYNTTDSLFGVNRQQLASGPGGVLYAAGNMTPSIWIYPQPHDSSAATRIVDPTLGSLGGIAVDGGGNVYVSNIGNDQGRIRMYDPDNLRGNVTESVT